MSCDLRLYNPLFLKQQQQQQMKRKEDHGNVARLITL